MLTVSIPGFKDFVIKNVLFDLNGTLACDGILPDSTREGLIALSANLTLFVMSADTHGTLQTVTADLPVQIKRVQQSVGAPAKHQFLLELGADRTIAVGNGRNDVEMLRAAALGIVILGREGAAKEALLAGDLAFCTIDDALHALMNPKRLVATLRG
jgi:soluble P-type ATPase